MPNQELEKKITLKNVRGVLDRIEIIPGGGTFPDTMVYYSPEDDDHEYPVNDSGYSHEAWRYPEDILNEIKDAIDKDEEELNKGGDE